MAAPPPGFVHPSHTETGKQIVGTKLIIARHGYHHRTWRYLSMLELSVELIIG